MKCKKGDIVGSAIYDFLNNVKIEKVCGKKCYFFNRRLNKMDWFCADCFDEGSIKIKKFNWREKI